MYKYMYICMLMKDLWHSLSCEATDCLSASGEIVAVLGCFTEPLELRHSVTHVL